MKAFSFIARRSTPYRDVPFDVLSGFAALS